MKQPKLLKRALPILAITLITLFPATHRTTYPSVAANSESVQTTSDKMIQNANEPIIDMTLSKKIEDILQHPKLKGAITGISVRNAATGETVYSHFSDTRLRPASNMKLLTGAAAMDILGPEYRFSTEVLTDGKLSGNMVHGNLYLKGKGDPTLLKKDLDQFAKELKEKGIQKVNGNLIADDSWYDDIRYSQDLNWSDEHNYVGAQVSALTLSPNEDYDAGTVIVEVTPGNKTGNLPNVNIIPKTETVEIVNKAATIAKGGAKTISVEREHGTNRLIIEGNMPIGGTMSRSWSAVWNPTMLTVDVFKQSLEAEGIQLVGNGKIKTGITPQGATVLATKESMPLKELFIPFMKLSNNGHGETLVKEMGKVKRGEGSWDAGLAVMMDSLKEFGVTTDSVVLRDGSGMSHKNLVSSDEFTTLLFSIQDKSWFPAFEVSLPLAGNPERMIGGTLRNRMGEEPTAGNVKAKTGSITGVSTLSGYVTANDGTELIFSILVNNYVTGPIAPLEDAIVTVLAEHEY